MIALLQRVSWARVHVAGEEIATIGPGLAVLVGVERDDGPAQARRLAQRLTSYRVFADSQGRMNLDVREAQGEILLVPQFTLPADTARGNWPSFTPAAPPAQGETLFSAFATEVRALWPELATGRFGAHMQVSLCNDGPVTFWLQVSAQDAKPAQPPH